LDIGYVARRNALIQAVSLDDVKRVSKRLFDPARLTVVVAGTPVEGNAVPQTPKPPVRPTPPPLVRGAATAQGTVAPGQPTVPGQAQTQATKHVIPPAVKPTIRPRP
jgi:zinc protease